MTGLRIFITGMGAVSPAGDSLDALNTALRRSDSTIRTLSLFKAPSPLPVGEIPGIPEQEDPPRTHRLAAMAAEEALYGSGAEPDAIVLGGTTGGMLATEERLRNKQADHASFQWHGLVTVAQHLARLWNCSGPVINVSTACSSSTAAIKIAFDMLRAGMGQRILAGGADSLCRLTYHGFKSLQLVDPRGAKPFDRDRQGMSVGEGAAMLLLVADETPPADAVAEIIGGGLSCDAYHAATPHPQGHGALKAMRSALDEAAIATTDIDYINLHGTGTPDGDLSEAGALSQLWGQNVPHASSVKGMLGHSLGAAGAMETIISARSIADGFIPANTGCVIPDESIHWEPCLSPVRQKVDTVLTNSFGFGGNNASLLLRGTESGGSVSGKERIPLTVKGTACITGAGDQGQSLGHLRTGNDWKGTLSIQDISSQLEAATVRRMKRLPRMALALAKAARSNAGTSSDPGAIFWGTGWGPLSETHDFLNRLEQSEDHFASAMDFIGAVHNAPAGNLGQYFGAEGPNITTTAGDYSFEQALYTASLMADQLKEEFLVLAADEYHQSFSPLFDASVHSDTTPSDGGGALWVTASEDPSEPRIMPPFLAFSTRDAAVIPRLVESLGGKELIRERTGTILLGIPARFRSTAREQLHEFFGLTGFQGPAVDYRRWTGEFASASAAATALAVQFVREGSVPASLLGGREDLPLGGREILLLGLGEHVTGVRIAP